MSRVSVILTGPDSRRRVCGWVMKAPINTRVDLKEAKRSLPQNDRMWAMLTDVARQLEWHGLKLSADDWKLIFLAGLKQEMRLVPNLDGSGFVNLGRSSSDLTKAEMTDLIELIFAFGAQHGVAFNDPETPATVAPHPCGDGRQGAGPSSSPRTAPQAGRKAA